MSDQSLNVSKGLPGGQSWEGCSFQTERERPDKRCTCRKQMKLQGKETGGMLSGLEESVWAALGCGHDSFEWRMLLQP